VSRTASRREDVPATITKKSAGPKWGSEPKIQNVFLDLQTDVACSHKLVRYTSIIPLH
jgi:hypothetical protein